MHSGTCACADAGGTMRYLGCRMESFGNLIYYIQCASLYPFRERMVIMSPDERLELEYEQLYNMRDQAILFLKMMPETQGYVNEILTRLDEMVNLLGRRLEKVVG